MHAQEYAARAAELKEQQEKNSALKLARAHYDAAGGDPNAVDPKTGMFYMTPSDRECTRNRSRLNSKSSRPLWCRV